MTALWAPSTHQEESGCIGSKFYLKFVTNLEKEINGEGMVIKVGQETEIKN